MRRGARRPMPTFGVLGDATLLPQRDAACPARLVDRNFGEGFGERS